MRARKHKASIGHTIDMLTSFFIQRYNHDKVLIYLHGLRGPDLLQVTFPPLQIFNGVEFGYGGMSSSSFLAKTAANSSTAASASSMAADAASAPMLDATTYPDDTLSRSIS